MHPFLAALVGGVFIGLAATLLMLAQGRIFGVSGTLGGLLPPGLQRPLAWRVMLVLGILAAPVVYGFLTHAPATHAPLGNMALTALAGLLVGLGTTLGSGCTSGHGVCGLARLSPRSLVATLLFMASAMVTVFVVNHL